MKCSKNLRIIKFVDKPVLYNSCQWNIESTISEKIIFCFGGIGFKHLFFAQLVSGSPHTQNTPNMTLLRNRVSNGRPLCSNPNSPNELGNEVWINKVLLFLNNVPCYIN